MREHVLDTLAPIEKQLCRELTVCTSVVVRCEAGYSIVAQNEPRSKDGAPFPTLYWLTCPASRKSIARLEADGLIGELALELRSDTILQERLARSDSRYRSTCDAKTPPIDAGIAGCRDIFNIKCLHAHAADWLAAGLNPIGELVLEICPLPTSCKACADL